MTPTHTATTLDRMQFFIDNTWVAPQSTDVTRAVEAATGEPLGAAAMGDEHDIARAVAAARRAFDEGPWGRTTAAERADAMLRFADELTARGPETAELTTRENGMPIALSELSGGYAPAALLQMYAALIRDTPLEEVRPSVVGSTIVRREPVGVVGAIVPWNYPHLSALMKIAPALAAGCTVVLKHSPETALDSYIIGEAAVAAGLPPGVVNIVLGDRAAGAALVSAPGVDKIAFTGSTAAGRQIGAECGRLIRRVTLELGGKSAAIICDDADLNVLTDGMISACFQNNSQTCVTNSRILAPRSRYDEVIDTVAAFVNGLTVGDPFDRTVQVGPMASETHLNRVLGYIQAGRDSDARLVAGGGRPAALDRGWFVEPTVFADVDNNDVLAREEVFGPVFAVIPYDTDEDAVRIANDSNYGLAGSVWTADEQRGLDIARRIRTGTIGVNYYSLDFNAPFGGMKDSGVGRELGPEAINAYLEYKSVFASASLLGE